MDYFTMMTLGKAFSEMAPELSYHMFQIAHYKFPDMQEGNSAFRIDTGDTLETSQVNADQLMKELFKDDPNEEV